MSLLINEADKLLVYLLFILPLFTCIVQCSLNLNLTQTLKAEEFQDVAHGAAGGFGGGGGAGGFAGGGGGDGTNLSGGGGGGGSFNAGSPPIVETSGVRAGNGVVEITFTPDTTPPMINCPADITQANDPGQGATAVCSPASGTFFPVGTTMVTCTATDASGNTSTCTFNVTVIRTGPPCPAAKVTVFGQTWSNR